MNGFVRDVLVALANILKEVDQFFRIKNKVNLMFCVLKFQDFYTSKLPQTCQPSSLVFTLSHP